MMYGMCKTKHKSKDGNGCLFIISKIDWSSRGTREFINLYTVIASHKTFLSLKYLVHFFLIVVDCTFYKSTTKSNCILLCTCALEAIVRRCYVKKALLETSQNSQENTCARNELKYIIFNKIYNNIW